MKPIVERFYAKVEHEPNTGCWLWVGALNQDGYAQIRDARVRKTLLAHRYSFERTKGPIPPGMEIDHCCRVRCCVNPEHLRLVTPYQNKMENSLAVGVKNAAKTHCIAGHVLPAPINGRRRCRTCANRRTREWYAREHLTA